MDAAIHLVQAELRSRIDALLAPGRAPSVAGLCGEIDQVRRLARRHGVATVADLASALETAMARGGRGPIVESYLALMREAAGCERIDAGASAAWLAAASVRLI